MHVMQLDPTLFLAIYNNTCKIIFMAINQNYPVLGQVEEKAFN